MSLNARKLRNNPRPSSPSPMPSKPPFGQLQPDQHQPDLRERFPGCVKAICGWHIVASCSCGRSVHRMTSTARSYVWERARPKAARLGPMPRRVCAILISRERRSGIVFSRKNGRSPSCASKAERPYFRARGRERQAPTREGLGARQCSRPLRHAQKHRSEDCELPHGQRRDGCCQHKGDRSGSACERSIVSDQTKFWT